MPGLGHYNGDSTTEPVAKDPGQAGKLSPFPRTRKSIGFQLPEVNLDSALSRE